MTDVIVTHIHKLKNAESQENISADLKQCIVGQRQGLQRRCQAGKYQFPQMKLPWHCHFHVLRFFSSCRNEV